MTIKVNSSNLEENRKLKLEVTMNTFVFMIVGKGGKYMQVEPDYPRGRFSLTHRSFVGSDFVQFGFSKKIEKIGRSYLHPHNSGKSKEEIRSVTFKSFVDNILLDAGEREMGICYILIDVKQNTDTGQHWQIDAEYKLLIRN